MSLAFTARPRSPVLGIFLDELDDHAGHSPAGVPTHANPAQRPDPSYPTRVLSIKEFISCCRAGALEYPGWVGRACICRLFAFGVKNNEKRSRAGCGAAYQCRHLAHRPRAAGRAVAHACNNRELLAVGGWRHGCGLLPGIYNRLPERRRADQACRSRAGVPVDDGASIGSAAGTCR